MWEDETTRTWMQYVSKAAASRFDVISLQEQLDSKLVARQAREVGICPVREDLYAQCFGACAAAARVRRAVCACARAIGCVVCVGGTCEWWWWWWEGACAAVACAWCVGCV